MTTTTLQANVFESLIARVQDAYAEAKATYALRQKYIATYDELNQLQDRDLEDLGLKRFELEDIAHKHVYGA